MTGAVNLEPSDALIAENTAILERFARDGVDVKRVMEIDFIIEFSEKTQAEEFRSAVMGILPSIGRKYDLKGILNVLCSYEDEGRFESRTCVKRRPDALSISVLESALNALAPKYQGDECCWEFADPSNDEVLARSEKGEVL